MATNAINAFNKGVKVKYSSFRIILIFVFNCSKHHHPGWRAITTSSMMLNCSKGFINFRGTQRLARYDPEGKILELYECDRV